MAKWRWGRRHDPGGRTPAGRTAEAEPAGQWVTGSGNAFATNGGIAVTGIYNDHTRVVLPPEAVRPVTEVGARPGLDNLPYRSGHFVGRTAELDRLDAALAEPGGVWLQAVHGLGGVGKSALAVHWAATRARTHGLTPVRWITADSPAAVEQGLAALATALQPATSKALTTEALAENGTQWLAAHDGWLLVLDNVTDPADIAPLLARAPHGRFLITSRLATVWHDATTVIRLDTLQPGESLALLTRVVTAGGPRDLTGAAALCAELGHLPLAVEQAAAFLAQNPLLTPLGYLDLLGQDPAPLYRQGGVGVTDPERTVARVWRVSLDQVAQRRPGATDVLRTLAWYAPDRVPAGLLDDTAAPAEIAGAVGVLNAYSLITVDAASHTLSLHRLVQSVARTPDADDPHRGVELVAEARDRATSALFSAVRSTDWQDPANWPTGRALLPHMDALAAHTPVAADTGTTARLLTHAGVFLLSQGLGTRAARHLRRALEHHEGELGEDDIHTLTGRHNLAHALEASGRPDKAVPLYERALADEERVLGPDHPLTVAGRNNLADAYRAAGEPDKALALLGRHPEDVALPAEGDEDAHHALALRNTLAHTRRQAGDRTGAVRLYEENLDACRRVLGEDHPLTLVTRNNLTAARTAPEDPAGAVPLFERTLQDMERVLGEDHPDTLLARANLAGAHRDAGDTDRAVAQFERALPAMERVLGPGHATTRATRVALALTLRAAGDGDRAARLAAPGDAPDPSDAVHPDAVHPDAAHSGVPGDEPPDTRAADIGYGFLAAGDPERAVPLFEQADAADRERLGEDHPRSLTVRHNLAVSHLMAGAPDRALPLFREVLRARERTLGADHPDTLTSRRHLADAHREAGAFDRAVPLYEETLHARTRDLGPHHPETLAVLGMLAYTLRLAGRPEQAVPLFERALHGREQVQGPSHPDTLTVRNSLAGAYGDTGDLRRAVRLYEENVTACARALGDDHPHTLTARHNLATAHAGAGDFHRAVPLLGQTLDHQERVLGPAHPDTITTGLSMAGILLEAGMKRESRRLYQEILTTCLRTLGTQHPLTRRVYAQMVAARKAGRGRRNRRTS